MAEFDSVIPAGGSGKLIAETRTTPVQARRLSKSITVQTDSADAPNLSLRFTVQTRAPILFSPNARFVVYAVQGEAARQRLLLRHGDGEKLEIRAARAQHAFLETVIEPVLERETWNGIEAAPGDVWLELVVPGNSPIGAEKGNLRLTTNHPLASEFSVPYVTRVRPLISSTPDGVRLWIPETRGDDGRSSFISLQHNRGGSFTITAIDVSHPEIFSATALSTEPAQRQTLRVELAESLVPESMAELVRGWVAITTDEPALTRVEVPVLVAATRAGTRRAMPHR